MPERVGPARREMIGGVHSMRALASGGALALAGLLGLWVAPAQAATVGISLEELGELAAAESARASLRREWRAGIDDPVRRREVLGQALAYIERQLELVRKRRDAIAALESELVAKRRRIRARQRELEREPEVNT
ncbi:MAG: hypothetical protein ACJ75R_05735 [Solirubrobacterales bacterium]